MLVGVFFILFSIKNLLALAGLKLQHHFFYAVASRLSNQNMLNYLSDDYSRFVAVDSSVRVRNISQQPIEFSHYILTNLQQIVSQAILIFFTACAILFYHPTIFLLMFLLLLPPVVLLAWFIRKKLKDIRANIKQTSEKTLQHLQESLAGYTESTIYGAVNFFSGRYSGYQRRLNENIATQQTLQALPSRLVEIFAIMGFLILVTINKMSVNTPGINLLTIGVFMAASYKIIPGIIKILNSTGQMKTYLFTLNDLIPESNKRTYADTHRNNRPVSSVRFENVCFSYKGHTVLKALSFEIVPGDFMGISGNSGKGKTTMINLLLGFLETDCGQIYINGKPATSSDRQLCRTRVSYVKQQPFFINDTIIKNITLSDDPYDAHRLEKVFSICGIDKLLESHLEGPEKIITENGKNISGGQRQRIMLARALYYDFDLLILDEPFSELDSVSETRILEQLALLTRKGKMILFITHHKESLSFCNKTLLLDEA